MLNLVRTTEPSLLPVMWYNTKQMFKKPDSLSTTKKATDVNDAWQKIEDLAEE